MHSIKLEGHLKWASQIYPGLILVNTSINDLADGKRRRIKFMGDANLGGTASKLEKKIQNGLAKLKKWPETNKMKFNKDRCKLLHLGRKNQMKK